MYALVPSLEDLINEWKSKIRIAVLYGRQRDDPGVVLHRTHHVRPWKGYQKVATDIQDSLLRSGFRHVITLGEDMHLGQRLKDENIHLVWVNSAGLQGYSSICHAASRLESLGIAYIGHIPTHSALLDDKHLCKIILRGLGLPTVPSFAWTPSECHPQQISLKRTITEIRLRSTFGATPFPLVVKPSCGRGSQGVQVIDSLAELLDAVVAVYGRTHQPVIIESYLPGREFCVGVGGPIVCRNGKFIRTKMPLCFSHVERLFGSDERIYAPLDIAPITERRARSIDPVRDHRLITDLDRLCRTVYLRLYLRALVRIDLRQDASGRIHILEVNPKPDLTAPGAQHTSLLALGLPHTGMSYDEFILCQLAYAVDNALCHAPHSLASLGPLLPTEATQQHDAAWRVR